MNTTISPEAIQKTKTYKKLSPMRQIFIVKKSNREIISNGVAICRNIGFDEWSKSCGLNSWNVEIVKDLFEKEK